jgi:rhodanese-related sulfurtransferase
MKNIIWGLLILVSYPTYSQSVAYEQTLNLLLKKTVLPVKVENIKVNSKTIFLDARSVKEFEISHLANAQYVGYEGFNINKIKTLPKDSEIIVYCSVGYRSEKIGEKLKQAGFKNVKNMWGGIFQWVNAGKIIVDKNGQSTQKIHAYSPEWGIWLQKGEKIYN